jgi:flagellar hook assembly protein FlgD
MTPRDTPTTGPPTDTPTVTSTPTPGDEFLLSGNTLKPGEEFIIHYKVSNPGRYSLRIYNSAGELVKTLRNLQSKWPVQDDVIWDGTNVNGEKVASGVYVVYFESSRYVRVAKVIVLH